MFVFAAYLGRLPHPCIEPFTEPCTESFLGLVDSPSNPVTTVKCDAMFWVPGAIKRNMERELVPIGKRDPVVL